MGRIWSNGGGLPLNASNLNALEGDVAKAKSIRWAPSTVYSVGDTVINPAGAVVTAKAAHTSGAIFNSANWNTSGLDAVAALALPGSKRSGTLRLGSTSSTVSGMAHNAFPGLIVLNDGTLLAAWRSAPQHDPTPTPGVIKARKYNTNLQPIGAEYTVLTDTYDLRDPMLTKLADGRILMQYFKHDGTSTTIVGVFVAVSTDNGATFTQLSKVPFTWDSLAACSGKVTVAPNGDWLVVGYGRTSATFQHARLMRSSDGGNTWTGEVTVAAGQATSQNMTETVIGTLPDGQTLMCLVRTANSDGTNPQIYRTTSTDNGATWSTPTAVISGTSGRPAWTRLASGGLLLIARSSTAPYPMQFWASWDSGATWGTMTQIGPTPNSQGTYAQPVEIAPGIVAAAYAIEYDVNSSSTVYLSYLADGYGYSPAGDDFTDPEGIIFKGAGEGGTVGGSSAASQVLGWPVWTLTKGAGDQCAFAFRVPAAWKTYNIELLWVNYVGGAAGNVYFRYDYEQVDIGGTMTSAAGVSAAVATGNQYVLTSTQMATGVPRTNALLRVKPTRLGTNASDTYASSIGVVGVRLVRAS